MKKLMLFLTPIFLLSACGDALVEAVFDGVEINEDITTNTTWVDQGKSLDYRINQDLTITGELDIEEGVTIIVADGVSITVAETGRIRADGRDNDPVKFISSDLSGNASWKGILINTDNPDNRFDNVTIEGAGTDFIDIEFPKAAAIAINGKMSISNCTIKKSGGYGLYIDQDGVQPSVVSCTETTFENCSEAPIYVHEMSLTYFEDDLGTCTFTDNTPNMVTIFTGMELSGIHEWFNPGIPYYLEDDIIIKGGLKINEGTEIICSSSAGFFIPRSSANNNYINFNGDFSSEDGWITISGEEEDATNWNGIWINTNNQNNIMQGLRLNGGETPTGDDEASAIFVSSSSASDFASLRLNGLTIENAACGIRRGAFARIDGISTYSSQNVISELCE